jgi:HAE1 family hydrophobic/amphiphilic exporter-1
LQVKQYEQNILVQVDDLVRQARSTYERVQARKQARTFAEEALDAEQKKYANGISTSFVVLDLQNQLTAARFQEVRALADYNNTLAELALSTGASLDRHQINLEFE